MVIIVLTTTVAHPTDALRPDMQPLIDHILSLDPSYWWVDGCSEHTVFDDIAGGYRVEWEQVANPSGTIWRKIEPINVIQVDWVNP